MSARCSSIDTPPGKVAILGSTNWASTAWRPAAAGLLERAAEAASESADADALSEPDTLSEPTRRQAPTSPPESNPAAGTGKLHAGEAFGSRQSRTRKGCK